MKRPQFSNRALRRLAVAACLLALCCWFASPKAPTKPIGEMTNSLGMKLMLIPSGEFEMGSSPSLYMRVEEYFDSKNWTPDWVWPIIAYVPGSWPPEPPLQQNEQPKHQVKITRAFYLGAHEVTEDQFEEFRKDTNYLGWRARPGRASARAIVPWEGAVAFCEWLSKKEGAIYRLPTEAEWEYACRAGTTTWYHYGDDIKDDIEAADSPNGFGLYDMLGSVAWCADWYDAEYYKHSPAVDPQGPASGREPVVRGRRSAVRLTQSGDLYGQTTGFRVVREFGPGETK